MLMMKQRKKPNRKSSKLYENSKSKLLPFTHILNRLNPVLLNSVSRRIAKMSKRQSILSHYSDKLGFPSRVQTLQNSQLKMDSPANMYGLGVDSETLQNQNNLEKGSTGHFLCNCGEAFQFRTTLDSHVLMKVCHVHTGNDVSTINNSMPTETFSRNNSKSRGTLKRKGVSKRKVPAKRQNHPNILMKQNASSVNFTQNGGIQAPIPNDTVSVNPIAKQFHLLSQNSCPSSSSLTSKQAVSSVNRTNVFPFTMTHFQLKEGNEGVSRSLVKHHTSIFNSMSEQKTTLSASKQVNHTFKQNKSLVNLPPKVVTTTDNSWPKLGQNSFNWLLNGNIVGHNILSIPPISTHLSTPLSSISTHVSTPSLSSPSLLTSLITQGVSFSFSLNPNASLIKTITPVQIPILPVDPVLTPIAPKPANQETSLENSSNSAVSSQQKPPVKELPQSNLSSSQVAKNNKVPDSKQLPCKFCEGLFSFQTQLDKHYLKSHFSEFAYECDKCGQKFRRMIGLKRHLPKHTGEKCHCCEVCDQSFMHVYQLINHLKEHTEELDDKFLR